ncbi:interferon regulatory factor 4-like isoform X1 [Huso huso]|uniref:Interferon regulatory factor 4-like isoform X1 n=1 Tax=Huso huso TaxID=61971 RepID=A0ABR0YGQ2_HUSHU
MGDRCRNMRLREWLIAQINSGNYAGLSWENPEKTMFRIPWKHAAKQDYNRDEDAALFKAWAVYKGKFREGKDKADPSTWKTRLRCAMNKSTDFQEVPERSQLDISEPYKVYEIMDEGDKKTDPPDSPVPPAQPVYSSSQQHTPQRGPHALQSQFPMEVDSEWEKVTEKPSMQYQAAAPLKPGDNNRHVKGTFYTWTTPGTQAPGKAQTFQAALCPYPTQLQITDFRMNVCLYYQGTLVENFTSSTMDGCRILHGSVPVENEHIYGPSSMEQLRFPSPERAGADKRVVEAMSRLLPHLERGVLLWVAPDGVFLKRLCQGRVYWAGPLAPFCNQPNKLERDKTCKLMDMQLFLQELELYMREGCPCPRFHIDLCFGEEFPDPPQHKSKKLITAHIEPLFARELYRDAQRIGLGTPHSLQVPKTNTDDGTHSITKYLVQ